MGWWYNWQPASFPRRWAGAQPAGFYHELSDAFLSGQLHLKRVPDARLAALPDPYDPAQNAAYRVNDLSYYQGRYYLYLGAAPALLVFIPFKVLTGLYLSERAAAAFLCLAGTFFCWAAVGRLRPADPRHRTRWLGPLLALVISLAGGYYVLVRGSLAQHEPIAGAYACGGLACFFAARALRGRRLAWLWIAASSLSLGLAIACRPNYLFAGLALWPLLQACVRSGDAGESSRRRWRLTAAALVPLGLCLLAIVAYNAARFGQIFDFGQRSMLGGWDQRRLPLAGGGQIGVNAWNYLLAPADYHAFFPFVAPSSWVASGVLLQVPWLWLLPLAAWALFRRGTSPAVQALGAAALVIGGANLLILILLPSGNPAVILTSANARYLVDFLPYLVLFVALGAVALEPALAQQRARRRVFQIGAGILALASAAAALSLDLSFFPPESYRPLAAVLNWPASVLERMRGEKYGALETDVVFPANRTGLYEPLVVTGVREAADMLYVRYDDDTHLRIGLINSDTKGPLSAPISMIYGRHYRLRIDLGSLYPPIGHPLLAALPESAAAFRKRSVQVQLDDQTVLDTLAHFHDASPRDVRLGKNPFFPGQAAENFSGSLGPAVRLPVTAPATARPSARYGPIRIELHFPRDRTGAREPLLATGVEQAGDLVYVSYDNDRELRIGLDHWGHPGVISPPLAIDYGASHVLEITSGALFPPVESDALSSGTDPRRRIEIRLDGRIVISTEQETYASSPYDVVPGLNVIGASSAGDAFTGRIDQVSRLPDVSR